MVHARSRPAGALGGDIGTQNMLGMYHERGAGARVARLGGPRDGKLLAHRLRVLADCGAYPFDGVMLPYLTRLMAGGVYALDRVDVEIVSVLTNTTPIGAFRLARAVRRATARDRTHGRPFRAGDRCRLGGRCAAATRHPATTPSRTRRARRPATTAVTTKARSTRCLLVAGYDALRTEQDRRRARPVRRSCSGSACRATSRSRTATVRASSVRSRWHPTAARSCTRARARMARGITPAFAIDRRRPAPGIPFERIEDRGTATPTWCRAVVAPEGLPVAPGGWRRGMARRRRLVDRARALAADLLEADPADVVLDPRAWKCSTWPARRRCGHCAFVVGAGYRGVDTSSTKGSLRAAVRLRGDHPEHVPVRCARRRRRGRSGHRRGHLAAPYRVRRRGHDHQPGAVRRPGARRGRLRHQPGALRRRCATTPTATRSPRTSSTTPSLLPAKVPELRARRPRDAVTAEPPRRQRRRRSRHHRRHSRSPKRRCRRPLALGRETPRHATDPRTSLARLAPRLCAAIPGHRPESPAITQENHPERRSGGGVGSGEPPAPVRDNLVGSPTVTAFRGPARTLSA